MNLTIKYHLLVILSIKENYIIEFSVIDRYTHGAMAWYTIKIKTVTDYSRKKYSGGVFNKYWVI